MADMSAGALTQLNIDLDAENQRRDGVIIDVRNNNGGFVNVYAIDVLARKSYFNMQPRGFSMVPRAPRWANARSNCRRSWLPIVTRFLTAKISPRAIARCSSARSWASRLPAGSSSRQACS